MFGHRKILTLLILALALIITGCSQKTYVLTYETNGGKAIEPKILAAGTLIELPTPVKEGFFFVGWFADEGLDTTFTLNTMPKGHLTIYAKWTNEDPEVIKKVVAAVTKAESTRLLVDIDKALTLINGLPEGTTKSALLIRINNIHEAITLTNATQAVKYAEETKKAEDVTKAWPLVNVLKDGAGKDELINRLKEVEAYLAMVHQEEEARMAVEMAEITLMQEDAYHAQELVTLLPNSDFKTALQNRLSNIQVRIDEIHAAEMAVEIAGTTYLNEDYLVAVQLVEILASSEVKSRLLFILSNVEQIITEFQQATELVIQAETTKLQSDFDLAYNLLLGLPDCQTRIMLMTRLNQIMK